LHLFSFQKLFHFLFKNLLKITKYQKNGKFLGEFLMIFDVKISFMLKNGIFLFLSDMFVDFNSIESPFGFIVFNLSSTFQPKDHMLNCTFAFGNVPFWFWIKL